jgi:hypothetical protein
MGGIGAGWGRPKRRCPAVMFAQILQQGPNFLYTHQNALTSGVNTAPHERRCALGRAGCGISCRPSSSVGGVHSLPQ